MRIRTGQNHSRGGFTLVEAVMAMLIVSILLVSAMSVSAGSAKMQMKTAELSTARTLAVGLLNDISALSYEDPAQTPVFGPETGESTTSKTAWNDVDDFNGWTESPPQNRDGTAMTNRSDWQRSVAVDRVTSADPSVVSATETGAKRITVTVKHSGVVIATRTMIRTKSG